MADIFIIHYYLYLHVNVKKGHRNIRKGVSPSNRHISHKEKKKQTLIVQTALGHCFFRCVPAMHVSCLASSLSRPFPPLSAYTYVLVHPYRPEHRTGKPTDQEPDHVMKAAVVLPADAFHDDANVA